jgi:zinc protease
MRSPAFLLSLTLAACASSRSAPPPAKLAAFAYDGFSSTFPTGLRMVVYGLPHMPDAMVSVSYRGGSVDDPAGKEGLAHLVEHLAFRARPGGGARVWDRLHVAGVEFNAFTADDSTVYYAVGQPDQLSTLLAIEADRLRDPLAGVDAATFEREREVVVRELAQRFDDASIATQLEWLAARAVPRSPYARRSTADTVQRLTLEDARAFVAAHYTPAHAIIAVTGPGDARAMVRRALDVFGPLATDAGGPPREPVAARPPIPDFEAPVQGGLETRRAPVERPVLWLGWTVPGDVARGGPRAIAAAEYVEARLRAVAKDLGSRVVGTRADVVPRDGVTLVWGRVELRDAADAEKIVSALRAERRFRLGLGGTEDVAGKVAVRDALLWQGHFRLESLAVIDIASWLRNTGDPDYVGGWQKTVAVALSTDTRPWVERYLRDERMVTLLVAPDGQPSAGAGWIAARARGGRDEVPPAPDVTPAPPEALARPLRLGRVERRTLANGLEVVVATRPGFPVVSGRVVLRTDAAGPTDQWLEAMALGVSSCMRWDGEIATDRVEAVAQEPAERIEMLLFELACGADVVGFDAPAFERTRRPLASELEKRSPALDRRAGAELLARLYPGTGLGRLPDAAAVRAFDTAAAKAFLTRTVRPERATLVLTGAVEPTPALWESIERRFGGWRGAGPATPLSREPLPLPARREVVLLDRPGATQATVMVGTRVPPRAERDEPAFRILVDALERGLVERFRVREAWTYGVSTGLFDQARGSALVLRTSVAPEHVPAISAALLDAVAAAGSPSQVDLEVSRARVGREHLARFGRPRATASGSPSCSSRGCRPTPGTRSASASARSTRPPCARRPRPRRWGGRRW